MLTKGYARTIFDYNFLPRSMLWGSKMHKPHCAWAIMIWILWYLKDIPQVLHFRGKQNCEYLIYILCHIASYRTHIWICKVIIANNKSTITIMYAMTVSI